MAEARSDPPPCRLYLAGPPLPLEEKALAALLRLLDRLPAAGLDIACLRLAVPEGAADRDLAPALTRIAAAVQPRDIALLVEDRLELVTPAGLDGLHLTEPRPRLRDLRARLGSGLILGVGCGLSRHAAMEAGEAEADYVSFAGEPEALAEITGWWAALMTVPCVAEGVADAAQAEALAAGGADFILAAPAIWQEPDPVAALGAFQAAIARGLARRA